MTSVPIIAVVSATGTQGKAVTKALSASGKFNVRALTRDITSEKAQDIGNFQNVTLFDANKLDEAFKGVTGVFAYSWTAPGEVEYMKGIVDAADKAGVDVFIYSSLPSAKEESNGKYNDVHHYERKQQVEKYLKTLKMKSIIIRLPPFVENMMDLGFVKKEGEKLSLLLNNANVETNQPMTIIDPDLGQAIRLIFENYKTTPSLFEGYIPITSYKMRFGDHEKILGQVTGREIIPIVMDKFGMNTDPNLDQMREYYDNIGIFHEKSLPDPRLTGLGYEPHDFAYYVRENVVPLFGI